MKTAWLTLLCAGTMLSASAWAQTESTSDQSTSNQAQDNQSGQADSSSGKSWMSRHLSATGHSGQPLRASKLIGAQVKDSSGNQVGQIDDIVLSPGSGRIDCAVVSLNSSGSGSSSENSSSGTTSQSQYGSSSPGSSSQSTSATSSGSSSGKQIAVPWTLLKTSSSGSTSGTYAQSSGSNTEQPTFTLNFEQSKLQQAPTFSWSDLNDSNWRQRTQSFFGSSSSSTESTGSAESPSGTVRGEGSRKQLEGPNSDSSSEKP